MIKINFQFIPYLIPLFVSSLIALSLAIYGYKYKTVRGAKPFIFIMLIGTFWPIANGLEMAGTDLQTKLFWANIQYFFYTFAPLIWLLMVFEFNGKSKWVNKRVIILLSILPIITIILVWTNAYHELMRMNVSLNTTGAFSVIDKDYGPWFWVHFTYTYCLNISVGLLLIRTVWRKNAIYRKQAFYLLLGWGLLFITNSLYVSGLSPIKRFDISPLFFSISGIIMGWGIFHFRLFDLVPVARATIMEEMGSGIIVIDSKKRIIDLNPEAREIMGLNNRKGDVGKPLSEISPGIAELISSKYQTGLSHNEFILKSGNEKYYYDIYTSPIYDYRKELAARVLILNDITDLKQARDQINLQQKELAVMDERERMARDLHDNLGQILSFSSVQIQAIRKQLEKNNFKLADDYLLRLQEIIRDAHKDIREYVYNVRDNIYYKDNFKTLLKRLSEEFSQNCDLEVLLKGDLTKDNDLSFLGTEEKMQLTSIIKEALTNVLKYAEANTVKIVLGNKEQTFKVIIEDDGKGIINPNRETGSGISIMNERARLIGGHLKIESQPGKGTKVIVELPFDRG